MKKLIRLTAFPPSKSYVNRLLVMAFMADALTEILDVVRGEWTLDALPDDIRLMQKALEKLACAQNPQSLSSSPISLEVGAAGTVLRFLTAVAAVKATQTVTFSATPRLYERPLAPLIKVLSAWGASINGHWKSPISSKDNFLIHPTEPLLSGGIVDSNVGLLSSQFISALLLVAPYLASPVTILIDSSTPSKPYIDLTLSMMRKAGAEVHIYSDKVVVYNTPYNVHALISMARHIEGDWSAASYIYGWSALLPEGMIIEIPYLHREDSQGDQRIVEIMAQLGVQTTYLAEGGIRLVRKKQMPLPLFAPNLRDVPDLVPALFVTALMLRQPFSFERIEHLRLKESDRLSALAHIAQRLGFHVHSTESSIAWSGEGTLTTNKVTIPTEQDHRLAMAWSIALLAEANIYFDDTSVVSKSYPLYPMDATLVGIHLRTR